MAEERSGHRLDTPEERMSTRVAFKGCNALRRMRKGPLSHVKRLRLTAVSKAMVADEEYTYSSPLWCCQEDTVYYLPCPIADTGP